MKNFPVLTLAATSMLGIAASTSLAWADDVHSINVTIHSSLCVGLDCIDGESYGADTIRLKEDNLRIHFDDTSTTGSFPANDWRIVANDQANGGMSYLGFQDVDTGRMIFRVEAGAPADALYVESDGDVGFGTISPASNLHVVDGDTPALRLEQNGSAGFTAQTWDVAGNESFFFVQNVTNGGTYPLRIHPGSGSDNLVVRSGRIGIGTSDPEGSVHVDAGAGDANLILTQAGAAPTSWEFKNQAGSGRLNIGIFGGNTPLKIDDRAGNNLMKLGLDGQPRTVQIVGDLQISGQCVETDGACADYVFGSDHERLTTDELRAFIEKNRHLPNVPSEAEIREKGINLAHFTGRLLEKIEELTLYALDQDATIRNLQDRVAELESDG